MVEKQRGGKSRCETTICNNMQLWQSGYSSPSCAFHAFLVRRRWQGYLNFLPASLPGMPMYWTQNSLRYLRGTTLWEKYTGMKAMPGCYVEPPCDVREFGS